MALGVQAMKTTQEIKHATKLTQATKSKTDQIYMLHEGVTMGGVKDLMAHGRRHAGSRLVLGPLRLGVRCRVQFAGGGGGRHGGA